MPTCNCAGGFIAQFDIAFLFGNSLLLQPGGVSITANGQGHCLWRAGSRPLAFIALIPLAD